MTVIRQYMMVAAEGQEDAMRDALVALAAKVRPLEGCEGVELSQDERKPVHFVFAERWASIDTHKSGGRLLGKEALEPVLAVAGQPPEGRYLNVLPLG